MIVWYDKEYDKLRMFPIGSWLNDLAKTDRFMVRLGEL